MGGRERGREGEGGVTSPRVLTALQQLIRFAAVRNTNDVPCRNLSAADLSFVAHIAHSLAHAPSRPTWKILSAVDLKCATDCMPVVGCTFPGMASHDDAGAIFGVVEEEENQTSNFNRSVKEEEAYLSQTNGCISVSVSG